MADPSRVPVDISSTAFGDFEQACPLLLKVRVPYSSLRVREEELVLAALQEEILSESKVKSQSAQRGPRSRMGRRSRRRRVRVAEGQWCLEVWL